MVIVSIPGTTNAQDRGTPRFGALIQPDTVTNDLDGLGRVWSLADLPTEIGRSISQGGGGASGRRRLLRGAVRLPDCSGAFVSNRGMVITAARCVRSRLSQDARSGFVLASSSAQEQKVADVHVDRLVGIDEVSARIDSLRRDAPANGEERAALQKVAQQLERRYRADGDKQHRVEVVSEAGGRRYVAYTYRRYEDVRLVFRPDPEVTSFGHVDGLLSYPQFAWDVAFLRVYDGGEPLQTPAHFELQPQGAQPGDTVFALGHPSSTHRMETHSQHAFRRDVTLPTRYSAIQAWQKHLQEYADTTARMPSEWARQLQEAVGERKLVKARLDALRSDYIMAQLENRDQALRRRADADTAVKEEVHTTLDRLAALQAKKRTYADAYRAFSFVHRTDYRSSTLARALAGYRRMQEGVDEKNGALRKEPEQPAALDAALLATHLRVLQAHLAADSTSGRAMKKVETPARIVRQSAFSDPDSARAFLEASGRAIEDDPALVVAATVMDRYASFAEAWEDLRNREQALLDTLARYRLRFEEHPVSLPKSRAPRLADGRVTGYAYNGTIAPPVTTFYGLWGQFASSSGPDASSMPATWQTSTPALDRTTPLTVATSTDVMGAYGGPLVDTSLQLVGLQIDGNVQAAAGTYLFLPSRMRTVSVEVRGILAALSDVYGAEALVRELTNDEYTVE